MVIFGSQKLMLSLLDNHCAHCNTEILSGQGGVGGRGCLSSYDFVYLPMDFKYAWRFISVSFKFMCFDFLVV